MSVLYCTPRHHNLFYKASGRLINRFRYAALLLGFCFTCVTTPVQAQFPKTFGSNLGTEYGTGLAVDGAGNVYMTGWFENTVDFDPDNVVVGDTRTSNGFYDLYVAKYNASGVLQWVKTFGSTTYDWTSGIAVDGTGNVYATGRFSLTVDFDQDHVVAGDTKTSNGATDAYVAKYNGSGILQWVKTFGNTSTDNIERVVVDGSGNVYATGSFDGTVDFDPDNVVAGDTKTSSGPLDVYILKYNGSGLLQWVKTFGSTTGSAEGQGLAVDGSGNIYATGGFDGTVDFDPDNVVAGDTKNSNGILDDIYVVKYNATGVLQWVKTFGSALHETRGKDVAVDGAGNVYATGEFKDTVDFDPDNIVSGDTKNSSGISDIYVAKYNSSGTLQWVKTFGSALFTESQEEGWGVAVDGSGNVYATGEFYLTVDFDPDNVVAGDTQTSSGGQDVYIAKYNSSGTLQWVKTFGSPEFDRSQGIAVDGAGNVYAAGEFKGTVDFDPDNMVVGDTKTSKGLTDAFLVKYNSSGGIYRIELSLRALLQGPFVDGAMDTRLQPHIPLAQPYTANPWSYNGPETLTSIPGDMVDWVLVQLRTGTSAGSTIATRAAILRKDGSITDLTDTSPLAFIGRLPDDYYIVVSHRNHIPIMSAVKVNISEGASKQRGAVDYDFTTSPTQAYGHEMMNLGSGLFGLYGGDANADGKVVYIGGERDQLEIINLLGTANLADIEENVYHPADMTLDGKVVYIGGERDQLIIINVLGISNLAGTVESKVPD